MYVTAVVEISAASEIGHAIDISWEVKYGAHLIDVWRKNIRAEVFNEHSSDEW